MKAETDVYYEQPEIQHGHASTLPETEHGAHLYLYLPDMSSQTGWAAHRVPERQDRGGGRPVGFRMDRGRG